MSEILSTQQVAKYLGLHDMTIFRFLKSGVIKGIKIGGRWRVRKKDIDALFTKGYNASA